MSNHASTRPQGFVGRLSCRRLGWLDIAALVASVLLLVRLAGA